MRASDGAVLVEGDDVTRLGAPQRARLGLGRAFQLTNLFPRLSVVENVRLAVQARAGVHYDMRRPWRASVDLIRRADAVLDSVGLGGKRDALASALSHGDQRKLEVAMMMALEPKIYMFDEPTAGMSVDEVPVVLDLIARLKTDATKTILLVEHKMDVVRSLADRIIVLTNGQLAADGDPATVIASPVVQEAYLGIAPGKAGMSAALTLEGVHTHIGRYHILQGVDFDAPAGRTTMLLGRNGAGKTTALRTIMGLWRASKGRIALGRTPLRGLAASDVARLGVGYAPETMAVFSDLTVKENLILGAREGPLDDARLAWIFGFFPALKKFWLSRAGALSGGQKQMLSIARAIVEPRELLLIDEPTKGLAPAIVGALIECLKEIKATGVTILLVEQNFRVAREVGDEVRVMDNGRIVHRGAMAELAADEPCRTACSASAWIRTNERARRRRRAAAAQGRDPAGADAADRRAGRRALRRLALDLRDADRRGARDGHDDLHHGLGADARLRHDGRAQLRPRRLHRARRLCRDARAPAARELVERRIRSRSISRSSSLAVVAAALVCGALGWVFERLIVKPVYGQHLRQILATIGGSIIAEQLLYALFGPDQIPLALPTTLRRARSCSATRRSRNTGCWRRSSASSSSPARC